MFSFFLFVSDISDDYGNSSSNCLFQNSYERAKKLLKTYSKEHKLLADALLTYETLDAKEIKMILEGKSLDPR